MGGGEKFGSQFFHSIRIFVHETTGMLFNIVMINSLADPSSPPPQPLLTEFNKEQEAFLKEAGGRKTADALPPWVGYPQEDKLKEEILGLSSVGVEAGNALISAQQQLVFTLLKYFASFLFGRKYSLMVSEQTVIFSF